MASILPTILWLRNDLRLSDHRALRWAAARGPVIPLYILEEDKADPFPLGGASKWWLREALKLLEVDYKKLGVSLILRRGKAEEVLREIIFETKADAVTWHQNYEPYFAKRDEKLIENLRRDNIEIELHQGYLLFDPSVIRTGGGTPFKVFTPFSKACMSAGAVSAPFTAPKTLQGLKNLKSDTLADWQLVPSKSKWPKGLSAAWQVGEKAAEIQLEKFIEGSLVNYKLGRDRPDKDETSRLSPYLHFGQVSPRQVWCKIQFASAKNSNLGSNVERYLLELLWREFSWHLLVHFPDIPKEPLNKSFAQFPWREDGPALKAWQKGLTGYPIIDAGMRQLWQTGWMHNRVRMITASFLIKDLLIDWRDGAAWFWDTLLDADLASNSASWQWVAGSGADAAPYFRIFNPTLQGQKFDKDGTYVKTYVPELALLDPRYIHEPWLAPPSDLKKAGIRLGDTYPLPIIDHGKARKRALEALKKIKKSGSQAAETKDLFD